MGPASTPDMGAPLEPAEPLCSAGGSPRSHQPLSLPRISVPSQKQKRFVTLVPRAALTGSHRTRPLPHIIPKIQLCFASFVVPVLITPSAVSKALSGN